MWLFPAEQAMRPTASVNIHPARNSWRKVDQSRRGRQDDEDKEGIGDDDNIHPAPRHKPPVDTPILRQMFATLTGVLGMFSSYSKPLWPWIY